MHDATTHGRGLPGDADVVVIVAGGSAPHPGVIGVLPAVGQVIAADSGYDHARALGLRVDVLIGDLDSISEEALAHAERTGITVSRHCADKDATDLELALDHAADRVPAGTRVVVVAGAGVDRLDHLGAQLGLLASPRYAHMRIEAWIERAHLTVVHGGGSAAIDAAAGGVVTLLPIGGVASGVRTSGMRFPLTGEDLDPFRTRGVSNVQCADVATVCLDHGSLLVIVPHALPAGAN